jgi:hypothetical protein
MDCGKEFLAVIESGSRKPLNCWYWGDFGNTRYQYFIRFDPERWDKEDEKPMWQRWLREYVPAYCYPEDEPSTKSIYMRWCLLLRGWLDRTPEWEMWTCPECVEKEEKESKERYSLNKIADESFGISPIREGVTTMTFEKIEGEELESAYSD